jgi:DNA-binding transcriptional LysR family regulator
MELLELRAFVAVVTERSFSRAAARLQRTQPAVSQAVARLEAELGQKLFDRSSNPGALTEAGRVLRDYAERVLRLADEAEQSVRDIEVLRRGRVVIGANDAGVTILLPIIAKFQLEHPAIVVSIQRVHARHIPVEVSQGTLDLGLLTFHASETGLRAISLGEDELVVIVYPGHPFAKKTKVTVAEWAQEPIIFHNDPSPARERAVRAAEERKTPMNVRVAVPTLDGIKSAVEMRMGISLLPRSCVVNELKRKQLIAVPIPELRLPRPIRLVYRKASEPSHATMAFLDIAKGYSA